MTILNLSAKFPVRPEAETQQRLERLKAYKKAYLDDQKAGKKTPTILEPDGTLTTDQWVKLKNTQTPEKTPSPFHTLTEKPIPPGSLKEIAAVQYEEPNMSLAKKISMFDAKAGQPPNGIYQSGECIKPDMVFEILEVADGTKKYEPLHNNKRKAETPHNGATVTPDNVEKKAKL